MDRYQSFWTVLFFILQIFLVLSIEPYKLLEVPEIKVDKWIAASEFEEDIAWESSEYLPAEELRVVGGNTFLVTQHVSGLSFICNSSHPIEWIFDQAEYANENVYDIIMKTSRESNNVQDSRNDRYTSILEIISYASSATGNYSCRSVLDKSISKSIFIYWEGSSPPYLVLAGKTVHVQSEDNQTVVLPCYVSQPDQEVQLYRELSGKFQQVPEGYGMKFNPKIGFTLDMSKINSSNLFSHFKCLTSDDDETDVVNVIVQSGIRPKQEFANSIERGAGLYFDSEKEEIVCCAKGNHPPSLHTIFCLNPISCRMMEHKLRKSGNNGKKTATGNCIADKVYPRDHGILRCKGEGIDVFRYFYTDFGAAVNLTQGLYFDWNQIIPERMMHISVQPFRPPFYHLQTISIFCEGMNSYFSDGHKWAIRWRNKSLTDFHPVEYVDDPHIHGLRNAEIKLDWKMTEIICYAPVWNSTKWFNKSVKLNVQKSFPPVIDGATTEEVYLVFNETEKLLECISVALPPASVTWTKNNEHVPTDMIIWKQNGTSLLMFHRVSHETQAEYKCEASNYAGTVQKLFHVYVEAPGSAWGTAATVIVPILCFALILTAGFLIWKMQLQKKVVDHLSRVVFRDVDRQT